MDKALQTQLANIEKRTGKTVDELLRIAKASGLDKHGQVRDLLKKDYGMGHGDANLIAHLMFQGSQPAAAEAPETASDAFYVGPKAALRPIHDKVMAAITQLRSVRNRSEEDLPEPAAQEAVRDGRPGDQHARRGGVEHEGRGRYGPSGVAPARRHVSIQSAAERSGGGGQGAHRVDSAGVRSVRMITRGLVIVALMLGSAAAWAGTQGGALTATTPRRGGNPAAAKIVNPVAPTEASISAGQKTIDPSARDATGPSGKGDGGGAGAGGQPADFTDDVWEFGSSDGGIFAAIQQGTSADMESYADAHLSHGDLEPGELSPHAEASRRSISFTNS